MRPQSWQVSSARGMTYRGSPAFSDGLRRTDYTRGPRTAERSHCGGDRLAVVVRSLATFFVASLLLCIVGCAAPAPPSPHWHDKAILNERIASSKIGGFNADEARLYHGGIQHLINAHLNVGSFTIRQVVDQEQARETNRSDARHQAAEQREHERLAAANRNRLTPQKVCSNLHTLLADVSSIVGGMECRQIQSDLWSIHYTIRDEAWTSFSYDQRLRLAKGLWASCIKAANMSSKPDSCNITLDGEAGERLGGSSWLAGSMIDVDKR